MVEVMESMPQRTLKEADVQAMAAQDSIRAIVPRKVSEIPGGVYFELLVFSRNKVNALAYDFEYDEWVKVCVGELPEEVEETGIGEVNLSKSESKAVLRDVQDKMDEFRGSTLQQFRATGELDTMPTRDNLED